MTKPEATRMTAQSNMTAPAAGKKKKTTTTTTEPELQSHVYVVDAEFEGHDMLYGFEKKAFLTLDGLVASVRDQLSTLLVQMTVENVDDYIDCLREFLAVVQRAGDAYGVYKTLCKRLTLVNEGRSRVVKVPFKLNIRCFELC